MRSCRASAGSDVRSQALFANPQAFSDVFLVYWAGYRTYDRFLAIPSAQSLNSRRTGWVSPHNPELPQPQLSKLLITKGYVMLLA
jgi:hypothetical protein